MSAVHELPEHQARAALALAYDTLVGGRPESDADLWRVRAALPSLAEGKEPPYACELLGYAREQSGKPYVWGAEADGQDHPAAFDCSELVQWICERAKIVPRMPDGSWNQARHCQRHRLVIPVEMALEIPGALVFEFSSDPFTSTPKRRHVEIVADDRWTLGARGGKAGRVGLFHPASGVKWTHAALIPGVLYG